MEDKRYSSIDAKAKKTEVQVKVYEFASKVLGHKQTANNPTMIAAIAELLRSVD